MDIHIQNFSKRYGKQLLFESLTFSINGRGIHGLMGANGSGKTTLMRAIAGLDRHYSGDIAILDELGKPIDSKDCTYVSPYPYMLQGTVYDNIAYPLKLRKWPADGIHQRVEEQIQTFQIDDLREKKASMLSAGETQKVALARALAFKPKILLLDEPTSNMDTPSIDRIETMLKGHHFESEGLILVITHDIDQVKRMCRSLYRLSAGQLTQSF